MTEYINIDKQGLPVEFLFNKKTKETSILITKDIPYIYHGKRYIIPVGFKSDGASIPRWFWRLIGHPFDMRYLPQAIFHDYLYNRQILTRAESDRVLYEDTKATCSWLRRWAIYRALRWFGWIAWNNHKKANEENRHG